MRRNIIGFSTALAATIVVAGSFAWADPRPISYVTSQWLKQACDKAGGNYIHVNEHYGCTKNCQSETNEHAVCRVDCNRNTKKCEGSSPDNRAAGGTIQQILRSGAFSDRRNVKTMTNNSGNFVQPPAGTRMINNSGTFQAGQPPAIGVPTTGVPNLAMPGRPAPSQGNLNMQKR